MVSIGCAVILSRIKVTDAPITLAITAFNVRRGTEWRATVDK
ncbi:Uncharacterised protein [Vibrio cholerae]|nr:Uncharacterised protein [Vibrio cholerae]CSI91415.1 Uncharacterised protein [Vibrio cholerae]